MMEPPRLGILGGMGPLATAEFMARLVRATPASCDQEHIPVIVCSLPQIPDRTEAILGAGASPVPMMQSGLKMLERCGVECIAIPCNTAHFWISELQEATGVPILHMVDAVASILHQSYAPRSVGLLATDATIAAGTYTSRLHGMGIKVISPSAPAQATVMHSIRAIKSGTEPRLPELESVVDELVARGAECTVLACTELSTVRLRRANAAVIDSTEALAEVCIQRLLPKIPSQK